MNKKLLLLNIFVILQISAISSYGLPIPESGLKAAEEWFLEQNIDVDRMRSMPIEEAAKRLIKAVYSFCRTGPQIGSVDDLFSSCSTACGGYSYVLRGLLERIGAETRDAQLYNIPNQGNHAAVEVKIGNRWGFLDPTFGAFFSDQGKADGLLMSLREITSTDTDLTEKVLATA